MLTGHTDGVTALAVLPDGRALSGSWDGTLRLWDLASGESRVLTGHTDGVTALAVLPDGRALSGSEDGTLRLWDLASGESRVLDGPHGRGHGAGGAARRPRPLRLFGRHPAAVGSRRAAKAACSRATRAGSRRWRCCPTAAPSPALRTAPCGCGISASGESRVLAGHTGGVTALAVLPDGRALSGSEDWSVIVWDVARGAPIAAFVGDAAITCVAATPTHIIAGAANGAVHLLRLRP